MKTKYRKFDQYLKSWYGGFKVGYQVIKSRKGFLLGYSQVSEKLSEKMKRIREKKRY